MLASSVLCAAAVFAGAISGRHQIFAIALATVWAFIAGMLVAIGGAAPDIGMISVVTLLIYAAQPLTPREAAVSGLMALGGGLLQTALSVALWPVRRYEPERRVLGNFYLELADRATAPLNATAAPFASSHSQQAQDILLALGRDPSAESIRYRALLNQGERIRLSILMLSRLRFRMERESNSYAGVTILRDYLTLASEILRRVGHMLLDGTRLPDQQDLDALDQLTNRLREHASTTPTSFLRAVAKQAVYQMDALNGQLRASVDIVGNNSEIERPNLSQQQAQRTLPELFGGFVETLRGNMNLQSAAYRHAIRLAVLVAVGDVLGRMVSWRRTYWLPMTIVLVLKPEFTATFTRGLLRIAGTVLGLLLATGLFHMIHPSVSLQIALIFAFVYLLRWLGPANYGIFGIVVSALIVLLLAFTGVSPKDVIWARGINTVAGGIFALLAYRLWPTWERTRVSERIAQVLDAYRSYFQAVVNSDPVGEESASQLERLRRSARIARSNLETSIDRLSTEPGTTRVRLSHLNAILASSHRVVHAIMAMDAIASQNFKMVNSEPLKLFAFNVEKTLMLLASALRGVRVMPKEFPDLRESYRLLLQASAQDRKSGTARYDAVNIEADRITNSVNTLAEQILEGIRSSPESAETGLQAELSDPLNAAKV